MEAESVDAIVCDPPYGLEFMGREWDSFRGEAWRSGAGMTKPGIGERKIAWPSFGGGDSANATCETCGGRMRGAKRCECEEPEWRVKGKPLEQSNARADSMRAFQAWCEEWAREALRVAKPGAHLVAFGGTRTYHRLACAIEDAGWEIRDCFSWLYGSGFPKSLDASKAIDKAAGAERDVVPRIRWDGKSTGKVVTGYEAGLNAAVTKGPPRTDAAKQWQGWGTALKPAWEPIILARKPLVGTVAANVLAHGTGALNIDACRIGTTDNLNGGAYKSEDEDSYQCIDPNCPDAATMPYHDHPAPKRKGRHDGTENWRYKHGGAGDFQQPQGRWPANVALDEEAAAMLDEQTGERPSTLTGRAEAGQRHDLPRQHKREQTGFLDGVPAGRVYADSGGASRFFYTAKASRAERTMRGAVDNKHPTVKPLSLMRWLVRLVCPPDGTVLDPFSGSGTTLLAAKAEGFNAIGIEREAEYVEIIKRRLAAMTPEWLREIESETNPEPEAPDESPAPASIDDLLGFGDE